MSVILLGATFAASEKLTDAQRMEFGRTHLQLSDEMIKAGVHVASEGLADPSLARWVSVRDGRTGLTTRAGTVISCAGSARFMRIEKYRPDGPPPTGPSQAEIQREMDRLRDR